jgi:serine-type D-Ala-D-Ala carboxypeptidase (penicillin-binding protein 5/6)
MNILPSLTLILKELCVLKISRSLINIAFTVTLAAATAFSSLPSYALKASDITSEAAVLIDADSGAVIFDKNKGKKMYPASTTKILTALLTIEKLKLNQVVTITTDVYKAEGTRSYLAVGEEMTVRDLLYSLLLNSSNDSAIALAVAHSGSVEKFAVEMNKRAKEIGATNSSFVNPNGLHNANHYTTAEDLALIAREAMKNPTFREIVKTPRYTIMPTNKEKKERLLVNANQLLVGSGNFNIEYKGKNVAVADKYVTGIKTGYTVESGNSIVSSMTKNGRNIISVVLKAPGKTMYSDSRYLLDYGSDEMSSIKMHSAGELVKRVTTAENKQVPLYTNVDINIYVAKDVKKDTVKESVSYSPFKYKSSNSGQVGEAVYSVDGKTMASIPLYASGKITDNGTLSSSTKNLNKINTFSKEHIIEYVLMFIFAFIMWRSIMTVVNLIKIKLTRFYKSLIE